MAKVVPTVLASLAEEYRTMLKKAESVSKRVHVDICDGEFADNHTITLGQVYVSEGTKLDLHLMVAKIDEHLESALSLHPKLIILHAESKGDLAAAIDEIKGMGVDAGVAILPDTKVESASQLIGMADHVLVFTGNLGHNGGNFREEQLQKVAQIREINPYIEISVDGGVNEQNAAEIKNAGVDVLYAGGLIQKADNPGAAFKSISQKVED